jgi:hypothetical protein
MQYVTYVTETCRKQAENYQLFSMLMKNAEKIEEDQSGI